MIRLSKCSIKNLHMRLFFLTPSPIGSINHRISLLTNRQVVLMGIREKNASLDHQIQLAFNVYILICIDCYLFPGIIYDYMYHTQKLVSVFLYTKLQAGIFSWTSDYVFTYPMLVCDSISHDFDFGRGVHQCKAPNLDLKNGFFVVVAKVGVKELQF